VCRYVRIYEPSVTEDETEAVREVLTVEQAAELLQLPADRIRALARDGKIPAGKVGNHWRFSRRALLRLVGDESASGE
jgi:excisionase family DNA binding protein